MKLLALISLFALLSCGPKHYTAFLGNSDGSKADGTLEFVHEHYHDNFTIDWEEAKNKAKSKCEAWGYSNAEFFDTGKKACIYSTKKGCTKWRTSYSCQCVN